MSSYFHALGTIPSFKWKSKHLTVSSNGMVFRTSAEIIIPSLKSESQDLKLPELKPGTREPSIFTWQLH